MTVKAYHLSLLLHIYLSVCIALQDSQKGVYKLKLVAEVSQTPEQEEVVPLIVQLISPPFLGRTVLTAGPAKFGMDLTKQEHGVRSLQNFSLIATDRTVMNLVVHGCGSLLLSKNQFKHIVNVFP